jgi:RNA polymerase sigma-70 factor, ECF subfamily
MAIRHSSHALQPPAADLRALPAEPQALDQQQPEDPAVVALVDRVVASRDRAAFGELYDQYVDRVYRYVYYRTGSQVDAEDLSEQVFLQAWAAMQNFRWQGKPFQAWLYRLAHNVLVDHYRRARPMTPLDDTPETVRLAHESASRVLDQWLDGEMLARAIGDLPHEQQHVIALRFLEGRDTTEVARLMDKREQTVSALQFRALQQLRRILERQGQGAQT